MKEKIDGAGRIRRKYKQLLDDIKGKQRNWKLKEETVECPVWITRLVARQNT
jgi:hypothetical protein